MTTRALRVGCLSFTAGADVLANAAEIHRGILAAAGARVRVLLTPECALTGYPGAARTDLHGLGGCALAEREEELLAAADRHGVVLVLGTAAPDGAGGWTNDAAALAGRYRKRCLTPGDQAHFRPGSLSLAIVVDGWRLGLAICYDLRFPDVWTDLAHADVDANLVLAHMAGNDPDPGTKAAIIPAFCAVRAAETATPLVFCNTAASDRWLDSGVWDARGRCIASGADGLLIGEIAPRARLAPWYAGLRDTYLQRAR
jgi:omega-amidase